MSSDVKTVGHVYITANYDDGRQEKFNFPNCVLRTGKTALAKMIAHEENDPFDFFVNKMLFGTNGTSGDVPKYVEETRTGLFGATLVTKNVISSIDAGSPNSVIFTAVLTGSEGNGNTINEMALRMANGDLYSMATFVGLGKTSNVQIVFDWVVTYL